MRTVNWSESAKADLWDIGEYWSRHSPARTGIIADRIDRAAEFLAGTPYAGPVLARATARKWRVARTAYVLIYRIHPSAVEILRVHHAAENWRAEP